MSHETKELRGDADADLVRALDALALAKGMTRNTYVNNILSAHVKALFAEHRLITRMCGDNPLLSDDTGGKSA